VLEKQIFDESYRLFIGPESYLVKSSEFITKANTIKDEVANIMKESILLRFLI
jgi:excinuclease UvrABC helicase subunit UvrB